MSTEDKTRTVGDFIHLAISLERRLAARMRKLAEVASSDSARSIFLSIASDSSRHAKMLDAARQMLGEELEKEFFDGDIPGDLPDLDQILRHETQIEVTYYAAKEHLTVEEGARRGYAGLTMHVSNYEASEVLQQLVADEARHHAMLSRIIATFRGMFKDTLKLE